MEQAVFAVLGGIGLRGVRLGEMQLRETALVVELGLVGQIVVAFLQAAGARVIGTDLEASECKLPLKTGASVAKPGSSAGEVLELTGGQEADAVLLTASTQSTGPIELGGEAVRQKGCVVPVGVFGLKVPRRPFYFKEASFGVSCSYGPGKYDPDYEESGHN